jgi:topoisomerase-4 subunit A
VGTDLKKDEKAEYVCDCSDLDEVIVFLRNGTYSVRKIADKLYVGKDIIYAGIFKKKDNRTIYNAAYRDGKNGNVFVKRFPVSGVTRDKEYDLTQGREGSQVLWFTANPNGEAEIIKIFLKARPKLKKLIFEYSFQQLAIKGRSSRGNMLSRYAIQKITLKDKGISTLGGQKIWFDADIQRLSADERGLFLGEFTNGENILAVNRKGTFYTTNYDLSNRYQEELLHIEKLDQDKIFSAVYYEGEAKAFYLKRFRFEISEGQAQSFIGDSADSSLVALSQDKYPRIRVTFGGKHEKRPAEIIDVAEFIGDKSFRAKGKRITTFQVDKIEFIEPLVKEEESQNEDQGEDLEFELDGPVSEGSVSSGPENPIEFHDEDAVQMTLL